jgi:hypothetical protein
LIIYIIPIINFLSVFPSSSTKSFPQNNTKPFVGHLLYYFNLSLAFVILVYIDNLLILSLTLLAFPTSSFSILVISSSLFFGGI